MLRQASKNVVTPDKGLSDRLHKAKGDLSLNALARRLGLNQQTVHNYFSGREPSIKFALAFCGEFDISIAWLLSGAGPMRASEVRIMEEQAEFLRAHQPDPKGQLTLPVQLQHLSKLEVMTPAEYKERVGELEGAESYTAIPLVADPVAAGPGAVIDAKNIEGFAIIYAGWVPAGRVTAVRVTGESMVPTLPPGSLIAVHHEAREVIDGDLYCLYDLAAEWAIVKRVRKTNVEAEFLVESDNPDKKAHPTTIWNLGAPEEGQAYSMIGRVIWSWTRFE